MTPLQTLLDERKAAVQELFHECGCGEPTCTKKTVEPSEVEEHDQESILQGVQLGFAMGRECVPQSLSEFFVDDEMSAAHKRGFNDCREETIDALEAKEKELGV